MLTIWRLPRHGPVSVSARNRVDASAVTRGLVKCGSATEVWILFVESRIGCFVFAPQRTKLRGCYLRAVVREVLPPCVARSAVYRSTRITFNSRVVDQMNRPLRVFRKHPPGAMLSGLCIRRGDA